MSTTNALLIYYQIVRIIGRDTDGTLSTSVYRLAKRLNITESELLTVLAVLRLRKKFAVNLELARKGAPLVIWIPAPLEKQKPARDLGGVLAEALDRPDKPGGGNDAA